MTANGWLGIRRLCGIAGGGVCGTNKWATGVVHGIGDADDYKLAVDVDFEDSKVTAASNRTRVCLRVA